ncbi:hypothetical protein OPT61_g8485 [Boeremia exigua]|uniref:Uncharacterized protein n=1 Tax=Boeremia exigua TaxID=749465 RepID=A0ACC2HYI4_9PLEO|nr:hypothetical protein OPT61_g8485 [Boeremia exigua]
MDFEPPQRVLLDTRPLKRAHSFVRIATNEDGSARVVTDLDKTPSPPHPKTTPVSFARAAAGLRRSYSAAGLNDRLFAAARGEPSPKVARVSPNIGRSRDSRAWEFWCDPDTRHNTSLTARAEQEGSGSAADAIGLLRANRRILAQNQARQNTPLKSRRSSYKAFGSSGVKKSRGSMQRASTFNVFSSGKKQNDNDETESDDFPSTESDKENWEPDMPKSVRRRGFATPASATRPRQILGENTNVISQSASLSALLAKAKKGGSATIDPEQDDELRAFMNGDNGSARTNLSSAEEAGCVEVPLPARPPTPTTPATMEPTEPGSSSSPPSVQEHRTNPSRDGTPHAASPALRSQAEFFMTGVVPVSAQPAAVCSACLDPLTEDVVKMVKCGHMFHCKCIVLWFQSRNAMRGACPNCRTALFRPETSNPTPRPVPPTHGRLGPVTVLPGSTQSSFGPGPATFGPGAFGLGGPVQWPAHPWPPRAILPLPDGYQVPEEIRANMDRPSANLGNLGAFHQPLAHQTVSSSERDAQYAYSPHYPAPSPHILAAMNRSTSARRHYPIRDMLNTLPTEVIESMLRGSISDRLRIRYEAELALRRGEAVPNPSPLPQTPSANSVVASDPLADRTSTSSDPESSSLSSARLQQRRPAPMHLRPRSILRQSIRAEAARRSDTSRSGGPPMENYTRSYSHEDVLAFSHAETFYHGEPRPYRQPDTLSAQDQTANIERQFESVEAMFARLRDSEFPTSAE